MPNPKDMARLAKRVRKARRMSKRGIDTKHKGITKIDDGFVVRVSVVVDGKKIERDRKLKGATISEAIIAREELKSSLTQPEAPRASSETVAMYSARWLEHLATTGRNREKVLSQKRNVLKKYVNPFLGNKLLLTLRKSDLGEWMGWLSSLTKEDGSAYKKESMANVWRAFFTMMKDAVMLADMPTNICDNIRFTVAGMESRKKDSLTSEELQMLLEESKHESPDIACMMWMLATTGMRFSEVSALQWEDIDLVKGTVHIRRSQVEKVVGLTKTKRARVVMIVPQVKQLLIKHKDTQKQDRIRALKGMVFPSLVGTYRHQSCLTKPLAGCSERAGITKHVSSHVFRHSFNNLSRQHSGEIITRAIVGHVSSDMTEHYSSVGQDEMIKAQQSVLVKVGKRSGDRKRVGQ